MSDRTTWHCSSSAGYCQSVQLAANCIKARKRELAVQVSFAQQACMVQTREGSVQARAGDAIVTGVYGEVWPIRADRFAEKYREATPGNYVSVPKQVLALKMDAPFSVVLADGQSQLHGAAGDFLIAYQDGSLGIVAAHIFPVIYDIEAP